LEEIKDGKLCEVTIKVIEKLEEDVFIHYDAIGLSEIKNKKIAKDLREENRDKSKLLEKEREKNATQNAIQEARIKELETELEENKKLLAKEYEKNKTQAAEKENLQNYCLHLLNKLPLPKKPGKLRTFKEKAKSKFQQIIKKEKCQKQELVARIEVK